MVHKAGGHCSHLQINFESKSNVTGTMNKIKAGLQGQKGCRSEKWPVILLHICQLISSQNLK